MTPAQTALEDVKRARDALEQTPREERREIEKVLEMLQEVEMKLEKVVRG